MEFKYKCLVLLAVILKIELVASQTREVPSFMSVGPPAATPTVNKQPDLSQGLTYTCVPLEDTDVCDGYNEFSVPVNGNVYSIEDFEKYVKSEINGNLSYIKAACSDPNASHDYEKIAYRNSVYCGRYMYAQARWCTENSRSFVEKPEKLLCKSTCDDFANSISDYGKYVCKNADNTQAEKIAKNIKDKWCVLFSDEEGCIKGTNEESKKCGYSSSSIALNAKDFNPSNRCFGDPNKIEEIKKIAQEEETVKKSDVRIKFYSIPIIMVVIGALTFIAWKKQQNRYLNEFDIEKVKKNEDIIIPPSKAAPSRDYLSGEGTKSGRSINIATNIKVPEAAATRSSSFKCKEEMAGGAAAAAAATAAAATSSVKKGKSVVYMVAIYNYNATMEDELSLKKGDRIRVEHQYDDGWGAGINETTKKFGAFPLICCSNNFSSSKGEFPTRNASQKLRSRGTAKKNISPLADENNTLLDDDESKNNNDNQNPSTSNTDKLDKYE